MKKENFLDLLGNSPKVTEKPIPKIINSQLKIQQGQFTQEELNVVLRKLKEEKLQASAKYLQKYGRQENLMSYF